MKSQDSRSDLPPEPPPPPPPPLMGQTGGHKIPDFVFLPYISFILAFRILQYIKMYWETVCEESR